MSVVIGAFTIAMGWLLDIFFQGLSFVGYPRLWACIVLYAIVTRFLFLPKKINEHKKRLLKSVAARDLYEINPDFFDKAQEKVLLKEKRAQLKKIYKKYGVTSHSALLMTIIQYPFLVALFYVVKNPQDFVPSLEAMGATAANLNTFLGVSLDMVPSTALADGGSALVLIIPVLIMGFTFLKMFSSVRAAKTKKQKIKVYSLVIFFMALLGWFSYTLPLVIALYWATNDLVFFLFDLILPRLLKKNKRIRSILAEYEAYLQDRRAKTSAKQESQLDSDTLEETVSETLSAAEEPATEGVNEQPKEVTC